MSERIIQIFTLEQYKPDLESVAKECEAIEQWGISSEDDKLTYHILANNNKSQKLLDMLQEKLPMSEGKTRILILPVEAHLPHKKDENDGEEKTEATILREELQQDIRQGAALDRNYLMLVGFATVVAAIGLLENNVAVLIGAMVIAPFLGPNLAMMFAAAMGESKLFIYALKTSLAGTGVAFALAFCIGFFFSVSEPSQELNNRALVEYSSIFLALASGSAAVLSMTRGISSVLVGVMVAVALLPPLTASSLFLGLGLWDKAANAALLLVVNIVCINLAGVLTFALRGIGPRSWWEKRKARNSVYWACIGWGSALAVIFVIIALQKNL